MSETNGNQQAEARTFRGASLEELLPQIREELGADAMITRQRDGIVGGIGGFFGKKTVEVEARPSGTPGAPTPAPQSTPQPFHGPRLDVPGVQAPQPAHVDLYDTSEDEAEDARPPANRLLDELYRQASPFAERLVEAEEDLEELVATHAGAEELLDEPAEPTAYTVPRTARRTHDTPPPPHVTLVPEPEDDEEEIAAAPQITDTVSLRAALAAAGVPSSIAEEVMREAETHGRAFDRLEPLGVHVARALADRIRVKHGWTTARRTIALVGPHGGGRTLAAAKLCHAYADGTGMSVAALSTERAARALRLGTLAEQIGVDFEIADGPEAVELARRSLARHDLVVADMPPIEAGDPTSLARTWDLLDALRPNEVHLVVPASLRADTIRVLMLDLLPRTKVHQLIVTHVDDQRGGGAVGASLTSRIPISYVADGGLPASGIHPAQPNELANLVLQ